MKYVFKRAYQDYAPTNSLSSASKSLLVFSLASSTLIHSFTSHEYFLTIIGHFHPFCNALNILIDYPNGVQLCGIIPSTILSFLLIFPYTQVSLRFPNHINQGQQTWMHTDHFWCLVALTDTWSYSRRPHMICIYHTILVHISFV